MTVIVVVTAVLAVMAVAGWAARPVARTRVRTWMRVRPADMSDELTLSQMRGEVADVWCDDTGNTVATLITADDMHGVAQILLPASEQTGHVTIHHTAHSICGNNIVVPTPRSEQQVTVNGLTVTTDNLTFATAVLTPHICYQLDVQRHAIDDADHLIYHVDQEHLTITRPGTPFTAEERDTVSTMLTALADTLPHPTPLPRDEAPR